MSGIEIKQVGKSLSFSWDNVFDVFTDVGVHGLASSWGSTPSAGNVAAFLKNVRKSVKLDEPPENAAFRLVLLCFAAAIDELRPINTETKVLEAARETVKQVKKVLKEEQYYLSSDFFNNPVSLPLYQSIRGIFVEALTPLWADKSAIGGKLDTAFNTSLFKIIRLEKGSFEALLKEVDVPGTKIQKLEQDWVSYREKLRHVFEVKPVFGQEDSHVSLSQIFIHPRAYWTEAAKDDPEKQEPRPHVLNLMPDMIEWAKDGNTGRCVRLLRGGPGSGKSSFAKAFCAEIAKDDSVKPLFIELQRLRGSGNLREKTTTLLCEHDEFFRTDPLSKEMLDTNRASYLGF